MDRSAAKFMEATGTAGNLSGLAPNGTAEPAVMVATGWRLLPVAVIGAEFLWAFAGGAAEFAAEVTGNGEPFFSGTRAGVGAGAELSVV